MRWSRSIPIVPLAEDPGRSPPSRPHFLDYASRLFTEFTPLAGDRNFANDDAIQAGLARFHGTPVAVIGQEKGNAPSRASSTISAAPDPRATARRRA